jgi:glycosyltransferase 2 family protein
MSSSISSKSLHASKGIKTALKILLVALLFYFLARKGLFSLPETGKALMRLDRILPGFAAVFATYFLAMARWRCLLEAQGFHLGWARVSQLSFIGNFFNVALPGSVSGDFVKAYYVAEDTKGQSARVFGTILFDRIAGVIALVIVSALALALNADAFGRTPLFLAICFSVAAAASGVALFLVYLFTVSERSDPLLRALAGLEARWPRTATLTRVYLGLKDFRDRPGAIAAAVGISLASHLLVCLGGILFAQALGEEALPAGAILVVVPLGFLVTAVPLMPGGIGTGHAAFSVLFSAISSARGADVFNLYVLVQLVGSAIGGLVYLRSGISAASARRRP